MDGSILTKVLCDICPANCSLKNEDIGLCGIVSNQNGVLTKAGIGRVSSICVEPIEKKPLYHFYPGSQTLSVGFFGCNMSCQYCQNHKVSHIFPAKKEPTKGENWSPERLINEALKRSIKIICFTYTETFMYIEYIKEVFNLSRQHNLKIIVSTNAYFNNEYWKECIKYVDAMNIDIKTSSVFKNDEDFNNEFDRNVLRISSKYRIIIDNLKYAISQNIPVECSLLITDYSYDDNSAELVASSLSEIKKDMPIHLLKYHAVGLAKIRSTSDDFMDKMYNIFIKHMYYVYIGFGNGNQNTFCPGCKKEVIIRDKYEVNILSNKTCSCGQSLNIEK